MYRNCVSPLVSVDRRIFRQRLGFHCDEGENNNHRPTFYNQYKNLYQTYRKLLLMFSGLVYDEHDIEPKLRAEMEIQEFGNSLIKEEITNNEI